jgi:hypothetical protein
VLAADMQDLVAARLLRHLTLETAGRPQRIVLRVPATMLEQRVPLVGRQLPRVDVLVAERLLDLVHVGSRNA